MRHLASGRTQKTGASTNRKWSQEEVGQLKFLHNLGLSHRAIATNLNDKYQTRRTKGTVQKKLHHLRTGPKKRDNRWDNGWRETSLRFDTDTFAEIRALAQSYKPRISFGEAVRILCDIGLEELKK